MELFLPTKETSKGDIESKVICNWNPKKSGSKAFAN